MLSNPFVWIMIVVILLLLIVIKSLAGVLLNAARNSWAEQSTERKEAAGNIVKTVVAAPIITGISDTAFYFIVGVIALEILVILYLVYNINVLLKADTVAGESTAGARAARPRFSFTKWWTKVNRFRPVEQEADLDMGHDYDGIRELDNKLPPWWKYGFYATMVFAVVYLWRYHVSHTAPLPAEEYQIAVRQAAVDQAAYLKHAANSVDENTVKILTDPDDLAAGKAVFQTICFACHGMSGEGGVGPNLTDNYWLHGGSIQEIFKTIKYGWPDKGMKSWKDDYSPHQIAQIASYVKSLTGTNPPNPKPPQGTLVTN
jgi:cytochrome c oxidase cbb3-type subunit 3